MMRPVYVTRQQSESAYTNPFLTDYSPMGNVPYPMYGQMQPNQEAGWGNPNQAFPYAFPQPNSFPGWEGGQAGGYGQQGYQQQGNMYGQQFSPYQQQGYGPVMQVMPPHPNPYSFQPPEQDKYSPFGNPLQTKKGTQHKAYPNPYPKQSFMQKPQPSGFQSIMNQFKTQDGSVDITKMMNTAGQMVGTVSQVQNMVKGLGGIFKVTT